jgi:6-pyruvoyltetrahydropterin/6-carboxytetrahydropterin synthase
MRYELSQRFYFEAAHTLERCIDAVGSRRIHGHTYWAEVVLAAPPDPVNGMVLDLGFLRQHLEPLREKLDHHLLDEVPELGKPTLENLCAYIARELQSVVPSLCRIKVWRPASGDACTLHLGEQ